MITIVDYGIGNLGSVKNMFRKIGCPASVSGDLEVISHAKKILLPGVGAFDAAMRKINSTRLREVLDCKALIEKIPILGLCVGMQLMTRSSEEGALPGLGWIPAVTKRFPKSDTLKVPHMGWNSVKFARPSGLTRGLPEESRYYFVHSYYVEVENQNHSILKTEYAIEFDAAIEYENIYGAQFHPEKSHKFGMQMLSNFAGI